MSERTARPAWCCEHTSLAGRSVPEPWQGDGQRSARPERIGVSQTREGTSDHADGAAGVPEGDPGPDGNRLQGRGSYGPLERLPSVDQSLVRERLKVFSDVEVGIRPDLRHQDSDDPVGGIDPEDRAVGPAPSIRTFCAGHG